MKRFANQPLNFHQQQGFSLLEALFSALILAIALFALAGFHVGAFKDSSLVKSRMVATNLAHEKLDDLRSYTVLRDDVTTTAVNECAAGIACFSEILADAGGKEVSSSLVLPSGTIAAATGVQDSFTRKWDVKCASSETSNAALSFGTCNSAITSTDVAKLVTVKITWKDSQGANQEIALQSVIYSMDPANGANVAVGPASGQGPKISYTPNNESVPISIGGGKSTETSRPLPEVSGGDSRRVTLPSVVYIGTSGYETVVTKEEFSTVNCTCKLKAAAELASTPHRTVWNGSALEQEYGVQISKVVGQPSDLSNNGTTNQDQLCIQCCADHHDTKATTTESGTNPGYPAYRPYVAVSEFIAATGDHKHYKADGTEATTTSDVYVEACRMKRIDGFWRVVADWQLIDLAVYGCDYFVDTATYQCPPSATASSTKLESYRTWLKNVLKAFVGYVDTNKSTNTVSAALPTFSSGVAPLLDVNASNNDITLSAGNTKQLITRGIYADVVFKKKSSGTPRAVDVAYVSAILPVYTSNDFSKLQYLPFYDANLTLLANWSPTSTNSNNSNNPPKPGDCSPAATSITYNVIPTPTSSVCVTSEAIQNISNSSGYYDDIANYSRGKLHVKGTGSTLITTKVARGNNGLTSSASIIGATDSVQQAQVKATIASTNTTSGVEGTVTRKNSGANLANVTITATPATGVSCVFTNLATLSTAASAGFNCTVPSGWVGTLTFGSSSSYTFSPAATTSVINSPAIGVAVDVYGTSATIKGKVSTDNSPNSNPKPDLKVTTVTFVGSTSGTCTSVATTANSGEVTDRTYNCVVPVGWTGYVKVDVDESSLTPTTGHTYLSPSSTPCTGSTTGSCNMLSISTGVTADVDGTASGATTTVQQQTNVTARR